MKGDEALDKMGHRIQKALTQTKWDELLDKFGMQAGYTNSLRFYKA